MRNIQLLLSYDGTSYKGWQNTNEGPSIESSLKCALETILQESINLQASSRTDAGVHAHGQVVNFFTSKRPPEVVRINSLLPKDIVVREIQEMPFNFHPTLNISSKEYHYWICLGDYQLPHYSRYSWHIHTPLNLEAMGQAALFFIGEHDFKAFTNRKKNESYETTIRTVHSLEIVQHSENRLQIVVKGPHFLYKMVRNIVGTLVYVGQGKLSPEDIPVIFSSRQRACAGITAEARGLTLWKIAFQ